VVLRDVAVVANRRAVEKPQGSAAHSGAAGIGRAHRRCDTLFECWIEIFIEEIDRLHDVHVAIDEPIAVFHIVLLFMPSTSAPGGASIRRTARTEIWSLASILSGLHALRDAGQERRSRPTRKQGAQFGTQENGRNQSSGQV